MDKYCPSCSKLFGEGDHVSFRGKSVYHVLKSSVAYALDKHQLEVEPNTLCHVNCNFTKGYPEE